MKKIAKILMVTLAMVLLLAVKPLSAEAAQKPVVKLNKSKVTMYEGAKFQLKQTGSAKTYSWWSNNQKVATVNSRGIVSGKRKGTATIVLKSGDQKVRCTVTVKGKLTSKQVAAKLEQQTKNFTNLTMSMYVDSIKYQNLVARIGLNKKEQVQYTKIMMIEMYITPEKIYTRNPMTNQWQYEKNTEGMDDDAFDMGEAIPKGATYKLLSNKTFNGIRCARLQVVDKKEGEKAVYYFDLVDYSLVGQLSEGEVLDGEDTKMLCVFDLKKTVKVPTSVVKNSVSANTYK